MGLFPVFLHLIISLAESSQKTDSNQLDILINHIQSNHHYLVEEIVFTIILSLIIAVHITIPLKRLLSIAERISNEDFSESIEIKKNDEIGRLGQTVNKMLNKLKTNKEMLQNILKQRSKKIIESEKKHRELLNLFADVIYEVDQNQRITKVKHCKELFGFEEKELIGKKSFDVVHIEDREHLKHELQKINTKTDKSLRDIKVRILTKSGEFRYALLSTRSLFKNGKFVGREGVLRDITKQEKLARKVIDDKEKLEQAYKSLNDSYLALGKVNAQVAALAEINTTFSSSLNWKEKLLYIIESIRIFMQADESILLIQNLDGKKYEFKNASLDTDFWKKLVISKRTKLAKEIIKYRKPVKCFNRDCLIEKIKTSAKGYKAMLAIPIIINNEVVGIFILFFKNMKSLEKNPTKLTLAYTSQMSIALMMSGELDHSLKKIF